jgi:hypothetical protein
LQLIPRREYLLIRITALITVFATALVQLCGYHREDGEEETSPRKAAHLSKLGGNG